MSREEYEINVLKAIFGSLSSFLPYGKTIAVRETHSSYVSAQIAVIEVTELSFLSSYRSGLVSASENSRVVLKDNKSAIQIQDYFIPLEILVD
ncbi:MAG: hypothetical protein AAF329_08435 [Cyanobacteria bacterium P01_A01_bin.17]